MSLKIEKHPTILSPTIGSAAEFSHRTVDLASTFSTRIKENQLGCTHSLGKIATATTPVGIAAGGLWYAYGDNMKQLWEIGNNPFSFDSLKTISSGILASGTTFVWNNLKAVSGGTAGFLGLNRLTGGKLRTALALGALAVTVIAAKKMYNIVLYRFHEREKDSKIIIENITTEAVTAFKLAYDNAASELDSLLETCKNDPSELMDLKELAQGLNKEFKQIEKSFAQLTLKKHQQHTIFEKIKLAVNKIRDYAPSLLPKGDPANNIKFLSLSPKLFKNISLPSSLTTKLEAAKVKQLGIKHTLQTGAQAARKLVKGSLIGSAVGLAGGLSYTVGMGYLSPLASANASPVPTPTATRDVSFMGISEYSRLLTTTVAGAVVGAGLALKSTYRNWSEELRNSKSENDRLISSAKQSLLDMYNNVATYLQTQLEKENNADEILALKKQAQAILKNIPAVHAQIQAYKDLGAAHYYTAKLQAILITITQHEIAPQVSADSRMEAPTISLEVKSAPEIASLTAGLSKPEPEPSVSEEALSAAVAEPVIVAAEHSSEVPIPQDNMPSEPSLPRPKSESSLSREAVSTTVTESVVVAAEPSPEVPVLQDNIPLESPLSRLENRSAVSEGIAGAAVAEPVVVAAEQSQEVPIPQDNTPLESPLSRLENRSAAPGEVVGAALAEPTGITSSVMTKPKSIESTTSFKAVMKRVFGRVSAYLANLWKSLKNWVQSIRASKKTAS